MKMSLDHDYSLSAPRTRCMDNFTTRSKVKRMRHQKQNGDKISTCDCEANMIFSSPPRFYPDDNFQEKSPLALLFPDCIMCLWSANIFSHAVVTDLHTRTVKHAGDEKPHAAMYSTCVNDWYEYHKVAEVAPALTKEECVAHFTKNILCRINRQRCQLTLLYNQKTVSQLVDTFPSSDTRILVADQQVSGDGKPTVYWCHSSFFSFLINQLRKLCQLTLSEKKLNLINAVLERHTDFFISRWQKD